MRQRAISAPKKFREALGIRKGDLAEVELEEGSVVITPKRLIQQKAFKELLALMNKVHQQNQGVSEEEVTRDVLKAIAELRAEDYATGHLTRRVTG